MRGKIIGLMIVAVMVAIGSVLDVNGTLADNSHVEYVVEPQNGIEVVQHGRSGLVEVEVTTCLVAGESFTFEMIVSADREGHSNLSVRKNSGVDISSWISLNPAKITLPSETTVTVTITPPAEKAFNEKAVARIQEIGDPLAPGGHHGVKVTVSCVGVLITPVIIEPLPTPSPTDLVPPIEDMPPAEGPTPKLEPRMPVAFPDSGGEPPSDGSDVIGNKLLWITGVPIMSLIIGSLLTVGYRRRYGMF